MPAPGATCTRLAVLLAATTFASSVLAGALATEDDTAPPKERSESLGQIERIDPFSGNLTLHHIDLQLRGPAGMDITVHRTYDLHRLSAGLQASYKQSHEWTALGPGWDLSAAPRLYQPNLYNLISNGPAGNYRENTVVELCNGNTFAASTHGAPALRLRLPDGADAALYPTAVREARTKDNWVLRCTAMNLNLLSPDGTRYDLGHVNNDRRFGFYGYADQTYTEGTTIIRLPPASETYYLAKRAVDPNGNWLEYQYRQFGTAVSWPIPGSRYQFPSWSVTGAYYESPSVLLSAITASDGRSVTLEHAPESGRLLSISDHTGKRVTYSYSPATATSSQALTAVTGPTGERWQYHYHPGNFQRALLPLGIIAQNEASISARKLAGLTLPGGGTVSYRYTFINKLLSFNHQTSNGRFARALTKRQEQVAHKSTSDGGTWHYSYKRGGAGQHDVTTVTGPNGITLHEFMGAGHTIATSSSSLFQNNAWQVGRPISRTHPNGSRETWQWQKRLVSNVGDRLFELGVVTDQRVWAADLQSKTVIRDGATFTTSYANHDAYGNPGIRTENGPNEGSRVTSLTWLNDPVKWIIGKPLAETLSGLSIGRSYDSNGNLLSFTRNGVTTGFTYDSQGNLASKTLPGGRVHTFANYKRGIAQSEVQPEGITITRGVDDAGNVTRETDGEGHTTQFTYDGLNRVTSKTPPTGSTQATTYTPTSMTSTRGTLVESTLYDPFGRIATHTLGGIATHYKYDVLGRRTFVSDPDSDSGTRYEYDALGRVTRTLHADDSYQAIAYGAASSTVTDEHGQATTYAYRGYGDPDQLRLMAITAAEPSANVALTRDGADRITSVTQGGNTRTYGYNANGYLTNVTNPETGTTTYGRDIAGNMTSRQVGSSGVARFTYDGQNRQVAAAYPGNSHNISHVYDKTGKLLASNSPTGNHSLAYDAAGNLLSESVTLDDKVFTARYAYNENDQLTSTTYPHSNRVVSYAPDVLGRPTTVSGYVNNVTYWPSGLIRQITYANGTQSNYEQNARLWPASFTTRKAEQTAYIDATYGYDASGNLLSISDSIDSAFNRTLGYDAINRLTSAAGFWGAGNITYDGGGNLLKQAFGPTSLDYTYDAQNRLASVSGLRAATLGYDAYGNVVSSGGSTYTYNDVPNLVCINCAEPASKVEYQYDGLNQRASVSKAGHKVYEMHDRDGKQLIELDGNTLTEYFYLGDKRIAQRVSP